MLIFSFAESVWFSKNLMAVGSFHKYRLNFEDVKHDIKISLLPTVQDVVGSQKVDLGGKLSVVALILTKKS